MIGIWRWFNGKKTTIGAILELSSTGLAALIVFLPEFGGLLSELGVDGAWIAVAVNGVAKVALGVGLIHKWFKRASLKRALRGF